MNIMYLLFFTASSARKLAAAAQPKILLMHFLTVE
jgi:hypothetical protein